MCHVPAGTAPSLYYLLSSGKAALTLHFASEIGAEDREAFATAVREAAFSVGIGLPETEDGDAAPVRIEVSVETGEGRTGAGTAYAAARARAVIVLHRARVEVAGRHAVSPGRGPAGRAALLDLAGRVARSLAD